MSTQLFRLQISLATPDTAAFLYRAVQGKAQHILTSLVLSSALLSPYDTGTKPTYLISLYMALSRQKTQKQLTALFLSTARQSPYNKGAKPTYLIILMCSCVGTSTKPTYLKISFKCPPESF